MTDTASDHCPREALIRAAAEILESAETAIASECDTMLLSLYDPSSTDVPSGARFYSSAYHDKIRREVLVKRAAKAAMAVLFADAGMQLPEHIGVAYAMPPRLVRS